MKKFLILLAAICCCGCLKTDVTNEKPTEEPIQNSKIKLYYKDFATLFYTVEIEGHLYVIYSGTYKGGIIHAEHCPCKMK